MKPNQPPIVPPWQQQMSRYRQRNYRFKIDDVIGWPGFLVLLRLGWPNEIRKGKQWDAGEPSPSLKVIAHDLYGNVTHGISYEPVPRTIPVFQPYQTWFYHNVKGKTWRLYLTRTLPIPILNWFLPRIVVEVYEHPTGAVF